MVYANCAVRDCKVNSRTHKEVHFHVLPFSEDRRKQWILAADRPDLLDKKEVTLRNTYICTLHFHKCDYGRSKAHLKKNAMPTLLLPTTNTQATQTDREIDSNKIQDGGLTAVRNDVKDLLREPEKGLFKGLIQPTSRTSINRQNKTIVYQLVFNQAAPSTSTTEQPPSTSAAEELQYQPSRYSIVSGNKSALVEEIVIKEEITDEERNQCRLCLSVGRRMQELGEYAPLYRKLLFENTYQHTTIPSFMFNMLACWECLAELRRVKRFQEKVRRANNAFETNQNQKCENLSNLSTILIGDYKNSNAGDNRPTSIEDCAQDIKEEAVEAEVEESSLPDPLAFEQDVKTTRQESEICLEIEHEPNTSITPREVVKRPIPQPKPDQRQPKRTKLDQNVANPEPLRAELDESVSTMTQEEEDYPKSVAETDCDAIFVKVKVECDELEKILTERRNKESFKSMKFKCDSCVLGFTDHNRLLEHSRNFHDQEVGSCECDICERRFDDDSLLTAHYRNHFVKFVCKLCNFECYTKTGRTIHFKRHKGALQGTSLEALLRKKLASEQRASAGVSSRQTST